MTLQRLVTCIEHKDHEGDKETVKAKLHKKKKSKWTSEYIFAGGMCGDCREDCMVAGCVYVLIARAEFQLKKGCCNANQSSSFRGKQKRFNGWEEVGEE
ncbi:hypothetical protein EXT70_21635 [Dickeya dadantii]|nr:hypothetical protein [Dickeya dadantii]